MIREKLIEKNIGDNHKFRCLDIQINFILLHAETQGIAGTWNNKFSEGGLKGGSVLDSAEKFFGKMEIHRFSSGFVLRYRALWDKIMGLLLLVYAPQHYDAYRRARSRRKLFRSLSRSIPQIGAKAAADICENLEHFDNTFRTAEMHGTGALRKWSFLMEDITKNPVHELIGFWNYANSMVATIGKLFQNDSIRRGV